MHPLAPSQQLMNEFISLEGLFLILINFSGFLFRAKPQETSHYTTTNIYLEIGYDISDLKDVVGVLIKPLRLQNHSRFRCANHLLSVIFQI